MDELDFTGKVALVVGGSSGIGNGIAQAFRRKGAAVYVWGTRASAADYAADQGSDLTGLDYARVDVSDSAAIEAWTPSFDRLDILVLSQGAVRYQKAEFLVEVFREVVEVNLNSLIACSMKFRPMLVNAKGSIIIVSSNGAFHATRGNPAYNASKAGAVGLTRTLGEAWACDGVRVNGIAPGLVATKMTKVTTDDPDRLAGRIKRIPLGRLGSPEDMAGVALFLASPLAAFVIGQTIIADGGDKLS